MFSEIQTIPDAAAEIKGSSEFPEIRGMVYFFGVHNGTIVAADIRNPVSYTHLLDSPDGDQGYPGNFSITVTYTLTDQNELKIHYEGCLLYTSRIVWEYSG